MNHNEIKKNRRIRIGKLENASDVRKFLARMIKKAMREQGGKEVNDAYKISLIASQLLKAVEVAELERRVSELEQKLKSRSSN